MKNLESVDDHLKELCKNPKFKKEYLKEKRKMSYWCYRIFKCIPKRLKCKKEILQPKPYYCIKEVFSPKKNLTWTIDPITPIADTRKELIIVLEMMLKDAKLTKARVEYLK